MGHYAGEMDGSPGPSHKNGNGMDEQQRMINERMVSAPTRSWEAAAVALLKLAEYNIPVDVQELLVHGNPERGIRPGSFVAALSAAIGTYNRT